MPKYQLFEKVLSCTFQILNEYIHSFFYFYSFFTVPFWEDRKICFGMNVLYFINIKFIGFNFFCLKMKIVTLLHYINSVYYFSFNLVLHACIYKFYQSFQRISFWLCLFFQLFLLFIFACICFCSSSFFLSIHCL